MNRIKELRKKKKISQSDIAKTIGVRQNTISQWENEIRIPNMKQGLKLAEILGTTVEILYK